MKNIWDKNVKTEENSYFNFSDPIILEKSPVSSDFTHIDLFSFQKQLVQSHGYQKIRKIFQKSNMV